MKTAAILGLVLLLAAAAIAAPWGSAPVAEFSARGGVTTVAVNTPLQFVDHSTGTVTAWGWQFGNGTIATEQHPVTEWSIDGDYTVSLTVLGPGGTDTETKLAYITVVP